MENKEVAKYLERIEIKGLWGRYDVDWKLNPDVNILVGENGTGKSTILDIIFGLINEQEVSKDFNKFESCKLITNDKTEISSKIIITSKGANKVETKGEGIEFFVGMLNKIKTFDAPFYTKTEKELNRKPYIISTLDDDLDVILDKYVEYQLNQTRKLRANGKTYESVFANQKYLIETINRLFAVTEKRVDEDENRLSFLRIDNAKIAAFELSSGEKQLLIILLTVLCQDEKPSILLLDEPELSLDLSWQFELINIIRQLDPNCQLIIITHSPGIYGKGWRDKVTFMENIVLQLKKQTA